MYLSMLNEEQKKLFLSFAYYVAMSDGDYSSEEQLIMESYCNEMKMNFDLNFINKDLKIVINKINEICEKKEKQIIIFEIIGLAMSDSDYDDEERKIISEAMKIFGINLEFGKVCENMINEYLVFQNKLNNTILL